MTTLEKTILIRRHAAYAEEWRSTSVVFTVFSVISMLTSITSSLLVPVSTHALLVPLAISALFTAVVSLPIALYALILTRRHARSVMVLCDRLAATATPADRRWLAGRRYRAEKLLSSL